MVQKIIGAYPTAFANDVLVVEAASNSIALAVHDNHGKLQAYELFQWQGNAVYTDILREVRSESQLIQANYANSKVKWRVADALLLPIQKPDVTNEDLLHLSFGYKVGYEVYSQPLSLGSCIYRVPSEWVSAIMQSMVVHEQMHVYGVMAEQHLPQGIWLQVDTDTITMSVFTPQFSGVRILQYHTPEDVLYHVLHTLEAYQLSKNTSVHCCGWFDVESALWDVLQQYLPNVVLSAPKEDRIESSIFTNYPTHSFTLVAP
ncbi:MAG: DUF3822 family protein [Chitinophagaceae bacterium]